MKLPTKLSHTLHKHGGQITEILKISHRIDKPLHGRSRDEWFFIGNVKWSDGGKSNATEIPPYAICYAGEDNRSEVLQLMNLLKEYLLANGKWYETGNHKGWYANREKIRSANSR